MGHPIYWIDGWVGGSRPPWYGQVEKIVSHSRPSVRAIRSQASLMGRLASNRLSMVPASRQGRYKSTGQLSIEVRHAPQARNSRSTTLDSSVHLVAKGRPGTSGKKIALSVEFGHRGRGLPGRYQQARRYPALGILRGATAQAGRRTWRTR